MHRSKDAQALWCVRVAAEELSTIDDLEAVNTVLGYMIDTPVLLQTTSALTK